MAGYTTSVSCTATGGASYNISNGTVTITMVPGGAVSCTYTNTAQQIPLTIIINPTGTGSGTVTASGISCNPDCDESYPYGTVVTLTATPDPGSVFAGWSGPDDCLDGQVTMYEAMECTATFNIQVETDPPSCQVVSVDKDPSGKPRYTVHIQDTGSGVQSIVVTVQTNFNVTLPTFTPPTTQLLQVIGVVINPYLSARLELRVTDASGNVTVCDPVVKLTVREDGKPVTETLTNIPYAENKVIIYNGNPGLTKLVITVNGKRYKVVYLKNNEVRTLSIESAMQPGNNNTIGLTAYGKPGTSAEVHILDRWPTGLGPSSVPLSVRRVLAQPTGSAMRFTAQGEGIAMTHVQVFALSGRLVYDSGSVLGTTVTWDLQSDRGQPLANGVYLYVITVQGYDGQITRHVSKLVVFK